MQNLCGSWTMKMTRVMLLVKFFNERIFFNKSVVLVVSCYSETVACTLTHIHTYTSRHVIFNNKPSINREVNREVPPYIHTLYHELYYKVSHQMTPLDTNSGVE